MILPISQTEFWLVVAAAYGGAILLGCALFRGWVR